MSLTPAEIWNRLLDRAKLELPEHVFRTWLEPAEPLTADGDTLFVGVPDRFAADWNESKHADLLSSYGPIALGHPIKVVFTVPDERKQRSQMDFFVAPPVSVSSANGRGTPAEPPTLRDRYTFDQFVVGKSNELAAASAMAVAESPGRAYNPLFIYGDTGLGKTHLMQAIGHAVLQRKPDMRLVYVTTEQFTNELIAAIGSASTGAFRRKYREIDLLLIDDIQFLKNKESTQIEFFHTFNALYEAGRQVVLTSDRAPSELSGIETRLVSRFESGMVADVGMPDFEHRAAILQKKAQMDYLELTIPDEVIRFVAENVRSSVRELEGAIIKLLAYASLKHREVSLDVAREALRDKLRGSGAAGGDASGGLTIAAIQDAVAREWGVTPEGLQSKTRTKTLTEPRQVAMFLAREILRIQLIEIGNAFGGRDHSTVIHSIEKVSQAMRDNTQMRKRVEKLRSSLANLQQAGAGVA